jgi:hypothetical protein
VLLSLLLLWLLLLRQLLENPIEIHMHYFNIFSPRLLNRLLLLLLLSLLMSLRFLLSLL